VVIWSQQDRQLVLSSLDAVGRAKPLGYLPLNTLERHLSMNVGEVAGRLAKRGLKTKVFSAQDCCINGGAIYIYDESALQGVLDGALHLLKGNQWPNTVEQFVDRVSKDWIEPSHPVYPVIKQAFGES
jgi:hypothetical protein